MQDDLKERMARLSPEKRALLARKLGTKSATDAQSIVPRMERGSAPASLAQKRLWFVEQFAPNTGLYNIAHAWRMQGPLDVEHLQQALRMLIARHETLRTGFAAVDGVPVQRIEARVPFDLAVVDLEQAADGYDQDAVLKRHIHEIIHQPFVLERAPLLRARLLRLAAQHHVLVVVSHHIVSDGWSNHVFRRELGTLYAALALGKPHALPALPIQYGDYAVWQQDWIRSAAFEAAIAYWRTQLAAAPASLELPTDRPRPAVQVFRGARHETLFPAALAGELKTLAQTHSATLFMVLLAAYQVLLMRYTGQQDLLVGTPVAGRNRVETEGLIGFFVNTLVLRANLAGAPTFRQFLAQVRATALGAMSHQALPFERLVEELRPERSLSHGPLVQVFFALQNMPQAPLSLPGLSVTDVAIEETPARFDLVLLVTERADGLSVRIEFDVDLFDRGTIERFAGHYRTLLEGIVEDPEQPVASLPILTTGERRQLLLDWNQTETDYPRSCLHELFEQQAARTPHHAALVYQDRQLSYAQLNERAEQVAEHLRRMGVGPDVPVALCLERSLDFVIGVLGVLKAGGAYVPMDPAYPASRLAYMLEDSGAVLMLVDDAAARTLRPAAVRIVAIAALMAAPAHGAVPATWRRPGPDNLAYIIYTSGSTGKPKGVQVEHRGIGNLALAQRRAFEIDGSSRVLQFASPSFDASLSEIAMTLTAGATLVIDSRERLMPGPELARLLRAQRITAVTLPPSSLAVMADEDFPALQTIIAAGESCAPELLRRWAGRVKIHNAYGPTETTVCATIAPRIDQASRVHIGRPLANTRVYILDGNRQPVPVGVPGELYIGGLGVARGYLNRAELNAEKFSANPFSGNPAERLYRTGDRARFLSDGNIELLGRLDRQVKLRGYRIELDEVEAALNALPDVRQACVAVRAANNGQNMLVGYVVARDGDGDAARAWRAALARQLPEHMVPSAMVRLDALPLTPNGKIDYAALPAPQLSTQSAAERLPQTPVEEALAEIWAGVLGVTVVSRDTNFFELGGHSLLATQVVARVRSVLNVELPLRALFEAPTVAGLAQRIEAVQHVGEELSSPALKPVVRGAELPLSFAQQRLWFLERFQPGLTAYNIPMAWRVTGPLDVAALERSLQAIIARHEVLRTGFVMSGGQPVQRIHAEVGLRLPVEDLAALPEQRRESAAQERVAQFAQRPFDLEQAPLLHGVVVRLASDDFLFALCVHHIVMDGWSVAVLRRELGACYAAFVAGQQAPLPPLPIQYADYALWQREWLAGPASAAAVQYWLKTLAGAPPTLDLPTDRPRPAQPRYRGATLHSALTPVLAQQLRTLATQEQVTLFMLLLSAFYLLLYRYSGQDDIVVGSPVAGRTRHETEELIGFFVNSLALRVRCDAGASVRQLLQQVRELTLGAYAHQDLPFERLVERLQPERNPSHSPLFQVMFAFQNAPEQTLALPGVSVARSTVESSASKFDLTWTIESDGAGYRVNCQYDTDLFDAATVARMMSHYQTILAEVARDPDQPLATVPLLSVVERDQLLLDWNRTARDFPRSQSIAALFAAQAAARPDAVAVVQGAQSVTYAQLDRLANGVARQLRDRRLARGAFVGVSGQRSIGLVAGMLGILKAGAAYVPLDPAYPRERLALMAKDAGLSVVLCDTTLAEPFAGLAIDRLPFPGLAEAGDATDGLDADDGAGGEDPAYVIYTSGSTGTPKGVVVAQRGVTRLVCNSDYVTFAPGDGVAHLSNTSFDAATFEIWGALLNGARLIVLDQDVLLSPSRLAESLRAYRVNTMCFTTSLFNYLAEHHVEMFAGLQQVIFGGEAADAHCVRKVLAAAAPRRLINGYGPTEATTFAAWYEIKSVPPDWHSVPIGRPIANTQLYILDETGNPVPVGVIGELYIGGPGVALGYHRRDELTRERFITDPLSTEPGARLYRTGDLARYLRDGNIVYMGRKDGQVKLRGFRIELAEIEALLAKHARVRQAAVIDRADPGTERFLAAYVVTDLAPHEVTAVLREHLAERLPEYMVPATYTVLERLPLTANGKLDRRALPVPPCNVSPDEGGAAAQAPRSTTEAALLRIWNMAFGRLGIGIDDDFFALGGHSLLAVSIMERIRQEFGRDIPLSTLFKAKTVTELARVIDRVVEPRPWTPVVPIQPRGSKPPFFCVHPAGGNVLFYAELAAAMDPDQPFYGLEARGVLEGQAPLDSIEAMAASYIDAVREVQPTGPYYLGGFSLGGTVAYEMACQLIERGEAVAFVLIGDTFLYRGPHLARWRYALRSLLFPLSLTGDDWRRVFRKIAGRTAAAPKRAEPQRRGYARHRSMSLTHRDALAHFTPRQYAGRVTVFLSDSDALGARRARFCLGAPALGWDRLARGGAAVHFIQGRHRTMIDGENAVYAAHQLTQCLQAAQQAAAACAAPKRRDDA